MLKLHAEKYYGGMEINEAIERFLEIFKWFSLDSKKLLKHLIWKENLYLQSGIVLDKTFISLKIARFNPSPFQINFDSPEVNDYR